MCKPIFCMPSNHKNSNNHIPLQHSLEHLPYQYLTTQLSMQSNQCIPNGHIKESLLECRWTKLNSELKVFMGGASLYHTMINQSNRCTSRYHSLNHNIIQHEKPLKRERLVRKFWQTLSRQENAEGNIIGLEGVEELLQVCVYKLLSCYLIPAILMWEIKKNREKR